MSPPPPSARAAIGVACALLCACGSFGEPHPPALSLVEVRMPLKPRTEPVVVAMIFDLELPDQTACENAKSRLKSMFTTSKDPFVAAAAVAVTVELAPGCRQSAQRRLNVTALRDQLQTAATAMPGVTVRPLILYVNSLDVPLQPKLKGDLDQLAEPLPFNGQRPVMVGITSPTPGRQLSFAFRTDWTYASDPGQLDQVVAFAETQFPAWTLDRDSLPATALLPPEQSERAVALKICDTSLPVRSTAATDGTAVDFDASAPPKIQLDVEPERAQLRSVPPPGDLTLHVEVCREACDHFFVNDDGSLGERWSTSPRCALAHAEVAP